MKKNNDVELQRVYEKPLTVFSKPIRVKKLILISITGMFLGVLGYIEVNLIAWIVFAIFFLALFIFALILNQKSILYFGEYSVEASPSGDMFLTKLHGHCSKCGGHLRIVKKKKVSFIQCENDKKHVWNLFENYEEEKKKN